MYPAIIIIGVGLIGISFFLGHNDRLKSFLTLIGVVLILVVGFLIVFFQTCPNCGWLNSRFVTNCAKCGQELEEEVFKGDSFDRRVAKLD